MKAKSLAVVLVAAVFCSPLLSAKLWQTNTDVAKTAFPNSEKSPRQVLEDFCNLDLRGKQLSPRGRQQLAPFFASTEAPSIKEILVVVDCVVSEPAMNSNKADFYVEQLWLGRLDSSLRYTPAVPDRPDDTIMLRRNQSLVLTDAYWELGPTGIAERKIVGQPAWRLDSAYEPSVSVSAAIEYVERLRGETQDPEVRENATKTLEALTLLKARESPNSRQKLYELFPRQNPCPEIGSKDALKSSAEVTARKIASAIEAEDADSVLAFTSVNGIGFLQLGEQWPRYSDLASEFKSKTGHYCRFFDTSCLKQPIRSSIAPWLPEHTYSYREWLMRSAPYQIDVDLTRATCCLAQIILVRSGTSSDDSLTRDLYLSLTYESGGWRLLSIGYGDSIP